MLREKQRPLSARIAAQRRTKALALAGQRPYAEFFRDGIEQRLAAIDEGPPTVERELTLDGLAAVLRKSPRAIAVMVKCGKLPAPSRVIGGQARWPAAAIEAFLQAR
jgi:predicted DNA-binding transcriptional regulator AlpA